VAGGHYVKCYCFVEDGYWFDKFLDFCCLLVGMEVFCMERAVRDGFLWFAAFVWKSVGGIP